MKLDRDSVEKIFIEMYLTGIVMHYVAGIIEALTDGIHNLPHEISGSFYSAGFSPVKYFRSKGSV